jgi:hypothetical protein
MTPRLANEIARLEDLSVNQLIKRYEEVFGEECRSRHKRYLIRRIAWRLQANEEGGLCERALQRANELAVVADIRVTAPRGQQPQGAVPPRQNTVDWDPRLPPPGNWIERTYKRRMIRVLVLADGFGYEGRHYRSLTSIAKEITGTHVNGFLFFRLGRKS